MWLKDFLKFHTIQHFKAVCWYNNVIKKIMRNEKVLSLLAVVGKLSHLSYKCVISVFCTVAECDVGPGYG